MKFIQLRRGEHEVRYTFRGEDVDIDRWFGKRTTGSKLTNRERARQEIQKMLDEGWSVVNRGI